MLTPQFLLPIHRELVVDLFAGGGGASTGIEQAIGRPVDVAVNHDPEAVSLHQANHPQTRHFVSDVFEVDPLAVTDGQPVGLLWASPDCKHFSKAKGGKPVSKKIRSLAWIVIKWAKLVNPRIICLENVEEFQTWGPLGPDQRPCPQRKGRTFNRWVAQLRNLGYAVEWRELRACDYGAPTIRKRLFLVARRDGQPIVWPEATHAAPDSLPVRQKKLQPWRTAAECIDWHIPAPSIFERQRPLAEATCRRIAKGIMRYVVDAAEPFIVRIGQQGGNGAYSNQVTQPLTTVTTKNEHCLAVPTLIQTGYGERPGQAPRVPGLDKPLGTLVGGQKHALVAAFMAKHYGGVVGHGLHGEPLHTVTSSDHNSIVTAKLEPTHGSTGRTQGTDRSRLDGSQAGRHDLEASEARQPAAGHTDHSEASRAEEQERLPHGENGVAGKNLFALGSPCHLHVAGGADQVRDGHQPSGRREIQQPARQPGTGDSRTEPQARLSAWTADACSSQGVDHKEEVKAFLTAYYGTDQDPRLAEPMHTVPTRDRFGLVMVHGEPYAIVDIGMRMLTPRELYRAQGFPESYQIERGADGRELTKTAQVRMCGNSVCPPLARALVAANYTEQQQHRIAA